MIFSDDMGKVILALTDDIGGGEHHVRHMEPMARMHKDLVRVQTLLYVPAGR